MPEGGCEAVRTDREVVSGSRFGQLEAKVHKLERLLGRKGIGTEMLREILEHACPKSQAGKAGWPNALRGSPSMPPGGARWSAPFVLKVRSGGRGIG
jgi:hypothetical protein